MKHRLHKKRINWILNYDLHMLTCKQETFTRLKGLITVWVLQWHCILNSTHYRGTILALTKFSFFFTHFAFLFCSNFLSILFTYCTHFVSLSPILPLIKSHIAREWWLHKIWYNDNLVNSIFRKEHMALWLHTGMQLVVASKLLIAFKSLFCSKFC